ncbi:MAG TPA: hypothetical protein VFD48_17620, partial [Pyrinomonadaceae bacterium]|nr:hypothetical protein [Pyrinomonadaceae bacterium]
PMWLFGLSQETFDFQRIHDLLRQTVTKAPCATFIRRILNSVSSSGNPLMERGDLEKLFFNVLNQKKGGFTRNRIPGGGPYGSAGGTIKANSRGDATIFLPEFPDPTLRNWSDAQGAIAELMHLAGKTKYTDYELAVAVNAIPEYASEFRGSAENNPFDPSYAGNAKDKKSLGYSSFWHGVQDRICAVPQED